MKTKEELIKMVAGVTKYSYGTLYNPNNYISEDEIWGECDDYAVKVESVRGSEGDGADMFLTISIADKNTADKWYIEFRGRYSSWDSSSYYKSYVVEPYQEMVTFYREIK